MHLKCLVDTAWYPLEKCNSKQSIPKEHTAMLRSLLNNEYSATQYTNNYLCFVNDVSIPQQVGQDF
ncbi:hypothetical protein SAMN05444008_11390 [Cnuella takakiae]|uniref:Uncharacterized protein n=1 Tax=Cnuella takakiae TaxID=1302690 RepID=A0A1M5F8H7_9BACT|nr:hypothetical protein SAMN05444008_11390 [Cnuella takakiae]